MEKQLSQETTLRSTVNNVHKQYTKDLEDREKASPVPVPAVCVQKVRCYGRKKSSSRDEKATLVRSWAQRKAELSEGAVLETFSVGHD